MYEESENNRFYRVFAVTTDKFGIDPLLDRIALKLRDIKTYTNHEVTQDERGSPELISLREYDNEDFWWHIMTYNGICRFRSIVEGQTLKIPSLGSIVSITNDTPTDKRTSGVNITTI